MALLDILSFPIEKGLLRSASNAQYKGRCSTHWATEAAQLAGLNQGNTRATSYVYIQYMNVHLNSYFSFSVKKELFGLVVLPGLFM